MSIRAGGAAWTFPLVMFQVTVLADRLGFPEREITVGEVRPGTSDFPIVTSMTTIASMEQLGVLIRTTRKAQGLRQPDLAGACGTSVRFLVELERGKPTAQVGKVLHVLAMLGLRIDIAPGGGS